MPALSDSLPPAATLVLMAALGLIFGSFVTALSYRLPRGISIAKGRSRCPACQTTLTARDLIPVVSWVMSRGACRACGTKVSWRYPAIEIVMAALFVTAGVAIENDLVLGLVLGMTPVMVALAVIDLEHRRLPNGLLAILAGFGIAFRYSTDGDLAVAIIGAFVVFAFAVVLDQLARRLAKQGLGMGDAKLMAVIAITLPPVPLLIVLSAAGVLGVMMSLFWSRNAADTQCFPLGPPLLAVFWTGLIML